MQFVVHGQTLVVVDDLGKDFLSGFDLFLVKLIKPPPLRLVVHQFFDASSRTVESSVKGHNLVDLNFNFHFHAKSMGEKPPVVKGLFFRLAENRVLTSLTHSADSVFLDAQSVTELGCRFAAGDASATSES